MTSQAERMNLYRVAASRQWGSAVELGPYFGASTAAIAAGLPTRAPTDRRIHVFDCFRTRENTYFSSRVESSALRSKTERFLRRRDGWLHWDECFAELCAPFSDSLVVTKALFQESDWKGGPISILHIDMPKDLEVGRHVFSRLFPSLQEGSIILFQDFSYHWSAEMIAAFGFLMEASLTRPISVVSNTLTLECKASGQELLNRLNSDIDTSLQTILRGIEFSINGVKGVASEEQIASLRIAYCQSLCQAGRNGEALETLGKVLRQHSNSKKVVRGAYEVLEGVFQMEKSY